MTSFRHDGIAEYLNKIDTPPAGEQDFSEWVKAEKQMEFLLYNAVHSEDIVMYRTGGYSYIYGIAVPENSLYPLNKDHLMVWSGNAYNVCAGYCWGSDEGAVEIEPIESIHGSKIFSNATQLFFHRSFEEDSDDDNNSYFELLQEYAHVTNSHWYGDRNAYCKISEKDGEIIPIVTITRQNSVNLVTFQREALEEYLAVSGQVLVRVFDFTLFKRGEFSDWIDVERKEFTDSDNLLFKQGVQKDAGYKKGIQIVKSTRSKEEIFKGIRGDNEKKKHFDFIIEDIRHRGTATVSTDPKETTNYFDAKNNDLPFELSPAFFNPEVLSKYKDDPDKYKINEIGIMCRNSWILEAVGVNDANQVFAYICYLRRLPESELQYWASFNEEAKAPISEKALLNDYMGEFFNGFEPLEDIKKKCNEWDAKKVPWWVLKSREALHTTILPLSSSKKGWGNSFKELYNLVIEGFDFNFITLKAKEKEIEFDDKERSLSLMRKILKHEENSSEYSELSAMRDAIVIRNKSSHRTGEEFKKLSSDALREHGSYRKHFEHVCSKIYKEMNLIESIFALDE